MCGKKLKALGHDDPTPLGAGVAAYYRNQLIECRLQEFSLRCV
jgi:hypothetical protein